MFQTLFSFLPYMKIQSHIGIVHLCTLLFSNYLNYTLCITVFKPSHILLPTLFQPGPLLVQIVLNAYMYTHIAKYSLLSSFNASSMYDFGVDFLTLEN